MPIKTIKTDLEFGQEIYIRSDPDQNMHLLVGIVTLPGNQLKFMLSSYIETATVIKYDFECTTDRGEIRSPIEEIGGDDE